MRGKSLLEGRREVEERKKIKDAVSDKEEEESEGEVTKTCEEVLTKLADDILKTLKRKTADKYAEIVDKVERKIMRIATKERRKPRYLARICARYADILGKEFATMLGEEEEKIRKRIMRRRATEVRRKEEKKKVEFDVMFM